MTDREAMQQALEALELYADYEGATSSADKAIAALRERLAQPETVMAEYRFQTYAAYKADGELKIGVVPEQEPAPGYCQHCKQYTIEEPLPAQPEQEPVAWIVESKHGNWAPYLEWSEPSHLETQVVTPLYTTPSRPEWVGLTDEEIDQGLVRTDYAMQTAGAWRDGVEWAQAQLREKNT